MKYSILIPIFSIITIIASSCKEDNKDDLTVYDVVISILEPEEDAVFATGEELHMEVDFDGTKALGNYEVLALNTCLLYTSPSPRDRTRSRMPSSA